MTSGQRGRRTAKAELIAAGLIVLVGLFVVLARPGFMGDPPWWDVATTASLVVGAAGIMLGFAWMIRIYRSDPEPDQQAWRHRQGD